MNTYPDLMTRLFLEPLSMKEYGTKCLQLLNKQYELPAIICPELEHGINSRPPLRLIVFLLFAFLHEDEVFDVFVASCPSKQNVMDTFRTTIKKQCTALLDSAYVVENVSGLMEMFVEQCSQEWLRA